MNPFKDIVFVLFTTETVFPLRKRLSQFRLQIHLAEYEEFHGLI